MWSEWLARTLKPRPAEDAAMPRVPQPAVAPRHEEHGMDGVRPSTARSARAQDEETAGLAADV